MYHKHTNPHPMLMQGPFGKIMRARILQEDENPESQKRIMNKTTKWRKL